ncbi:MAG TPA: hypothetical protein VMW66_02335, partial [Elusimicrobiales bacterium]|nr:hypothetical protein [Elusimicrobiales bacterium]
MQDIDINTTISEVGLFIEKLQSEMPEVFRSSKTAGIRKLLYMGTLYDVSLLRSEESDITFHENIFTVKSPDFRKHILKPL